MAEEPGFQEIVLADAEATRALGYGLAQSLPAGSVILLEGDLGAGKTTLAQGIGAGLGIEEAIASPTFTLICEYLEGRMPLYHLDLYRLEPAGVELLHLESYWESSGEGWEVEPGLMVVEWAERLPYLPEKYLQITLRHQPEGEGRTARLSTTGRWDEGWGGFRMLGPPFGSPL